MRLSATAVLTLSLSLLSAPLQAQEDYQLPTYTDAQRWNRASTLQTAVLVGQLAGQMSSGSTAFEAGRASARVFGPPNGWNGSDTPMRLLRGMYRNWMSSPAQTCEVLDAGETMVRARCNRPYLAYFGEDGVSYGVTLEQYEQFGTGFASGIAEAHGMDWSQRVDGDDLLITIRKR